MINASLFNIKWTRYIALCFCISFLTVPLDLGAEDLSIGDRLRLLRMAHRDVVKKNNYVEDEVFELLETYLADENYRLRSTSAIYYVEISQHIKRNIDKDLTFNGSTIKQLLSETMVIGNSLDGKQAMRAARKINMFSQQEKLNMAAKADASGVRVGLYYELLQEGVDFNLIYEPLLQEVRSGFNTSPEIAAEMLKENIVNDVQKKSFAIKIIEIVTDPGKIDTYGSQGLVRILVSLGDVGIDYRDGLLKVKEDIELKGYDRYRAEGIAVALGQYEADLEKNKKADPGLVVGDGRLVPAARDGNDAKAN